MTDQAVWAPPRPRIFYLHIPKTAGMALRRFLSNQYPVAQIMPATDWLTFLDIDRKEIEQYRLFQGHFTCGVFDLLPKDVRPIVFLREPVARTISHLKHLRRDPHFHTAHKLAAGRSLDELVRDDRIMGLCSNVQTAQLSNDIPGESFLAGFNFERAGGRVPDPDAYALPPDLAKAERALARFQFVGFVESLQEDVLLLSIALGLHPPAGIPKSNEDPDGEIEISRLQPETLAILRERNALDISLYEAARRHFRFTRGRAGAALLDCGIYAPISQPTNFPMSGPIPGSNWYDCEGPQGAVNRWTGPLNETLLDLPLAPGFRFEVSLSVTLPKLEDLGVHASGVELPLNCSSSEEGTHRVSFWVPADAVQAGGLTSLCFRTKRVFTGPGPDVRSLSFMVTELSISKVEPTSDRLQPVTPPARRRIRKGRSRREIPARIVEVESPPPRPEPGDSPLNSESKVVLVGEPTGFYSDGWVRARMVFKCRAVEAITSMSLRIWAPPGDERLALTLRVPAETDVTLTVPREIPCVLEYAIHAAPSTEFSIELLANHEGALSALDERSASYILRSITFS